MQILLKRIARKATYTIGKLYINNAYTCDTIEDRDREFFGENKKVPNETAIPRGTYQVVIAKSPRFSQYASYSWCKGFLPRLRDPKTHSDTIGTPPFTFSGVLMHAGNDETASAGCIILGENKVVGKVINSMATVKRVHKTLYAAYYRNEPITLTVI